MSAAANKRIVQDVFSELAKGNGRPFIDAMADDFSWTISGKGKWSTSYRGKQSVLNDLMRPLFAQFADRYTNTAQRIIAEDELVVVECRGRVTTKKGERYDNEYCYVIRMAEGKMRELTEYMDSALADAVLDAPA